MKAKINHLWWNPWAEKGLDLPGRVNISVDNLTHDPDADTNILILIEPREVVPHVVSRVDETAPLFDLILTYDRDLLDRCPNARMNLFGSTMIDLPDLRLDKQNHLWFVTSDKQQSEGQILRNRIHEHLKKRDRANGFEIYQHKSPPFHERRNDFFETCKFHVAVENAVQANWFTEKIVDCFVTETVPIYWGCPNIDQWFDLDGIITFNDLDQLDGILDSLTEDDYESRRGAMERNAENAKGFYGENCVRPRLTRAIETFCKAKGTPPPRRWSWGGWLRRWTRRQ